MSTQGASTSSLSSSSSSTPRWKYDVYLSFRGVDTRRTFTDLLYDALHRKGILAFRDDEKLQRGKYISEEQYKAMEESSFAIVILSLNYASSTWSLEELANIIRCKKEKGMQVFPVFYDIDPSCVRNQTGPIAEAFAKHEERFEGNIEKIQAWRVALREVSNLSGWQARDR